jgi:hypothetical protein
MDLQEVEWTFIEPETPLPPIPIIPRFVDHDKAIQYAIKPLSSYPRMSSHVMNGPNTWLKDRMRHIWYTYRNLAIRYAPLAQKHSRYTNHLVAWYDIAIAWGAKANRLREQASSSRDEAKWEIEVEAYSHTMRALLVSRRKELSVLKRKICRAKRGISDIKSRLWLLLREELALERMYIQLWSRPANSPAQDGIIGPL